MNLKEMVDKINSAPTVLVKVSLDNVDPHDMVVAKPAVYHGEFDTATIHIYAGPRNWREWASVRDANGGEENVHEGTLVGSVPGTAIAAEVNGVTPYETDLDTMPLRELPIWAMEMWVKHREMLTPTGRAEVEMNARMINGMNRLIDGKRKEGGINPRDMTQEMQARYLRLWNSLSVLDRAAGRKLTKDDLRKIDGHIGTLQEIVPKIRELPWRNGEGVDPESQFDREDVYEWLVDILHGALVSFSRLVTTLIMDAGAEGGEGR